MRIIIARHGETNENADKRLSGNSNKAQLIKGGLDHAKGLKKLFKNHKIEAVFSSPLDRAMETAKPIAKYLKLKIRPVEELREFDFGELDGVEEKAEAEEALFHRRKNTNFRFPKGESYNDVLKRVNNFLKKLLKKKHNMILVIGHGGVNRSLLSILLKKDPKDVDKINTLNNIVYEVDTETGICWWQDTFSGEKGEGLLSRKGV